MARARRVEKVLSSSTINRLLSARASNGTSASPIANSPCLTAARPVLPPCSSLYIGSVFAFVSAVRAKFRAGLAALGAALEGGARPDDANDRAAGPGRGVGEEELGAGALDQRLGDEQAEAEAAGLLVARALPRAAGRDIGLAGPQQHLGGKSRPVVADLEPDLVGRPARLDLDRAGGEIDGVVEDVGEPVEEPGAAPAHRLRPLAAGLDLDRDLGRALRLDDLLEEVADRHRAEEGGLVLVERGQLRQDAAAALDLLAQELEVVGHRPLLRQGVVELLRHERDRRERRAELVRGGGGEAVELRQVLLAGEHPLGRGERLGELARLLGDAPGIDADEGDAEQDRRPDSGDVEEGQRRCRPGPRQRPVDEDEDRGGANRKAAERQRAVGRQRRRRDQDRCQEQHRERVLQAAGQVAQRRELEDVEAKQKRRRILAEPVARRIAQAQPEVQRRGGGDDGKAGPERQREAEAEMHAGDGGALPDDGKPAQPNQRIEPQPAGVLREDRVGNGGHGCEIRRRRRDSYRDPAVSSGRSEARRFGAALRRSLALGPGRIPLTLHAPGKAVERAAPKPSTALSRKPVTQRSEVEGYPGPSARTCREAARKPFAEVSEWERSSPRSGPGE